MRKTLNISLLFIVLFSGTISAQKWYSQPKKNNEKYLVYASYGYGSAHWYSELKATSIYDTQGSAIQTGDFNFKATNTSTFYDLGVLFPAGNYRFGLGMNFEKFFLTQIVVQNQVQTGTSGTGIIFDESFRFDKLYMQFEVPFWPEARSKYSLSANMNVGMFSFNNVDRVNLFGSDALASNAFVNVSPIADISLFPGLSLFVRPACEFKYFKNQAVDSFGQVKHRIVTYSIMIGLRYDPSVVDELK